MQPLYTETEFKTSKSCQLLPLRCLHCTHTFYLHKHKVHRALNPKSVQTGDFCSTKCQRSYECPPIMICCEQCQKPSQKKPSEIKDTKHHFCSQSCAAKWNNTHKTKGTRTSKLEVWLQGQLPLLYPNIKFHFNQTDAINGELDIFIPSLRLAFELNGIFHYEPIYGPEKLAKMQTNDARKSQACLERDIELCIIDNSSMKNFKPLKAQKFLDIIKNIIDLKLSGSSPVISDCLVNTT